MHYFGPALLQLLDWCFDESLSNLDEETAAKGRNTAETVRSWAASFLESCRGDSTLSDLYQHLLPKFYELLLQFEPSNFSVTSTVSLLRFNQTTAHLPRFSFVGLFLEPSTRDVAKSAYSKAVAGGGMYALDHFGPNALPFDVVVPGVGRGTLHVEGSHVTVDFQPVPITVEATEPITTVGALAEVLAGRFGDLVVLVGKAVSLISMLSAEYILIFHETASGYTTRTTKMNEALRAKGVVLKLNPIVRLQYRSWDSLAGITESRLRLPKHLDNSFGLNGQSISANDFAVRWRTVIASERNRIEALKQARSLRQVIRHLEDHSDHEHWLGRLEALNRAILSIKSEYDASADVRAHIDGLKARINSLKLNRTDLEARSGDARRARQAGLAVDITEIENVEMYKRAYERSKIVTDARKLINEIDFEASTAKLQSARSAFLTTEVLPHINSRPTAWWLPMVDPTGTWFDNIADSVEARLEEV